MTMKLSQAIAIALLVSAVLTGARAGFGASAPRGAASGEPTGVSDRELASFAKAYVDYQRIRSQYGPAIEKEKDAARKKQIEQEANTKIKRSLDANGLSPEQYNRIFATVNGNETLRKRVLKMVEEERKNS